MKFYSSKKLRKKDCDYYIIIGQKSNGKSYDIKSLLLQQAYNDDDSRFVYMRRWSPDRTANKVERYFQDPTLFETNDFGEYNEVQAWVDTIYLGNRDDNGKPTRSKIVGYSAALSSETHYASMTFPHVKNIIFEEFITDSGYLGNDEVECFMRMVSTIFRHRQDTHVYMIGNTINRFCPYFSEFGIDINQIKKGTITYYTFDDKENDKKVKIGIEYCDDIVTNKLVIGNSAKMINGGEWQVNKVPLCKRDTHKDKLHFKFFVKKENSIYKCLVLSDDKKEPYIFVYPYKYVDKITENDRYFTDNIEMTSILHSENLTKNLTCDIILTEIYKLNRVCYSDSLTGTEFEIIRNERGWK